MLVIILLKLVAFLLGAIAADGRDVDKPRPVLDEGAALDGDVQICDVVQAVVEKHFEFVLPEEVLDSLHNPTLTCLPIISLPLYAISPFSLKK